MLSATISALSATISALDEVYVVADPDAEQNECHEGNNVGLQPNVACDTVE